MDFDLCLATLLSMRVAAVKVVDPRGNVHLLSHGLEAVSRRQQPVLADDGTPAGKFIDSDIYLVCKNIR